MAVEWRRGRMRTLGTGKLGQQVVVDVVTCFAGPSLEGRTHPLNCWCCLQEPPLLDPRGGQGSRRPWPQRAASSKVTFPSQVVHTQGLVEGKTSGLDLSVGDGSFHIHRPCGWHQLRCLLSLCCTQSASLSAQSCVHHFLPVGVSLAVTPGKPAAGASPF